MQGMMDLQLSSPCFSHDTEQYEYGWRETVDNTGPASTTPCHVSTMVEMVNDGQA